MKYISTIILLLLVFSIAFFIVYTGMNSNFLKIKVLHILSSEGIDYLEKFSGYIPENFFKRLKEKRIYEVGYREIYEELKKIPWVDNVLVKKIIPDTLIIYLVEKVPVAKVEVNGQNFYVSRYGDVFFSIIEYNVPQILGEFNEPKLKKIAPLLDYVNTKNKQFFSRIKKVKLDLQSTVFYVKVADKILPFILPSDVELIDLLKMKSLVNEIERRKINVKVVDARYRDVAIGIVEMTEKVSNMVFVTNVSVQLSLQKLYRF